MTHEQAESARKARFVAQYTAVNGRAPQKARYRVAISGPTGQNRGRRIWADWRDKDRLADLYANLPPGHHVDHIVPLISEVVCGLHVPENLQYLTASENCRKGRSFDPDTFDWWPEGIPRPLK